tara:strand:- start:139 stop:384 length:246 start_codon:yes stop_codon:yes gene_type:complete
MFVSTEKRRVLLKCISSQRISSETLSGLTRRRPKREREEEEDVVVSTSFPRDFGVFGTPPVATPVTRERSGVFGGIIVSIS